MHYDMHWAVMQKNGWLEHETEQTSEGLDASQLSFIMKFLGSFLQE